MFNLFAAVFIVAIVIVGLVALAVLVLTSVLFVALVLGVAWIAWRVLAGNSQPRSRQRIGSKSAIERLTDRYVSGRIDIHEFEQKVATVLHHHAP